MPKQIILNSLARKKTPRKGVANPVSSVTIKQMKLMKSFFPEAHISAKKMFELSRASYEILGYDAIMPVFSVVIESYAIGCKVDWGKIDKMPVVIDSIWNGYKDIKIKEGFLENHAIIAVLDCLSLLKNKYPDVAIIGKVFGPWTLSYHLFGIENFLIKTITNSKEVKDILAKLTEITVKFADAQIKAGADIITLADHCTKDLCSPSSYKNFLFPIHSNLAKEIKAPTILHICGDTIDRLDYICTTGLTAFHFESKVDACEATRVNNNRIILIGNINDPSTLLFGRPEDVRKEVEYAIRCGVDIIGPECAVPLLTPIANLKEITKVVRRYKA